MVLGLSTTGHAQNPIHTESDTVKTAPQTGQPAQLLALALKALLRRLFRRAA